MTKSALAAVLTSLALCTSAPLLAGDMAGGGKTMEYPLGDLTLTAPFARATLPNQPVAGAFLTIANAGNEDDVLVAVSTPVAGRSEIHEMAMDGDTMKMRPLLDGLVIPAGGSVELKPGGFHLMLMDLEGPLVEGKTFDATLEFKNAGSVTLSFSIQSPGAKGMGHGGRGS